LCKKISGANLHRNWVVIPHVTTHGEADITDLEKFRVQMNKELEKSGVKLSLLPFMIKAAEVALKKFPEPDSVTLRMPPRALPVFVVLKSRLLDNHQQCRGADWLPRNSV
jgi:hypothetical protein